MNWIMNNRAWLFSGILVAVPLAILGWLLAKRQITRIQKQRAGDRSINLQAGGNIDLRGGNREPDVKTNPKGRR